jgi:hypothetical protein
VIRAVLDTNVLASGIAELRMLDSVSGEAPRGLVYVTPARALVSASPGEADSHPL